MTLPERPGVPYEFVQGWAGAIHRACFVPMSRAQRCRLLSGLAGQLAAALRTEPGVVATVGRRVGVALVEAGFTAPEVLSRTITILHGRLLPDLGLTGEPAATRLAGLVEGVAEGFTRALRDRTLDDQEAIRLAATAAQAASDRALRASEARFRYAATHDPLTGLPNHNQLTGQLHRLLADPPPGARLGLCCVDLDQFAAINDRLGSPVGDRLLVAVAERLRSLATEPGQLVARHHGDRFVLLVPDSTGAEDATKLADRALAALAAPFQVDGHELSISASAGVVERPAAGASAVELVRAADVALHWAKADGRSCWALFEEQRSAADVARYRLSAALPAALRRGEFSLAYQPLVDLRTGGVLGYEALARWQHPEHGLLGADQFVEQAEDTGLIVQLGIRLLEQGCRQAAQWYAHQGDRTPYVSVNISARQLRQPGLVGEIAEVLDRTGLPPIRLQLEITESALVVTDDDTIGRLVALSQLGIRIVIDDFGTGYSNFAYLYDLPVHGIKLAGQLLRDVGRRPVPAGGATRAGRAGHAVLAALVSLGRTLGLTVTAEGVETARQAKLLRVLGCHVGQGFHFGRPAAPDQLS
ncbi:MAG: EAL domain-containing protein [Micromonosporaceae bacterium]|nr:EAL domain-containing protein [Micromonosporaceae bacterium]